MPEPSAPPPVPTQALPTWRARIAAAAADNALELLILVSLVLLGFGAGMLHPAAGLLLPGGLLFTLCVGKLVYVWRRNWAS